MNKIFEFIRNKRFEIDMIICMSCTFVVMYCLQYVSLISLWLYFDYSLILVIEVTLSWKALDRYSI